MTRNKTLKKVNKNISYVQKINLLSYVKPSNHVQNFVSYVKNRFFAPCLTKMR